MDMMPEMCVERMQLSDSPDDWVWVRWYECEAGAKPFPFPNRFGFAVWENVPVNPARGAQIHLTPSQWRPRVVSPFPGQHFHGKAEWFRDGLPRDARPTGDATDQCGVPVFDSEVTESVDVNVSDEVLTGGQAQGGEVGMCVPFGTGLLGGQAQGGEIDMGAPRPFALTGGQAQGGEVGMCVPFGTGMIGGQAQGGMITCNGGYWFILDGGQAQGGEVGMSVSGGMLLSGGQAQGGSPDMGLTSTFELSGGQAQSGLPHFVGGYEFELSGGQAQGGDPTLEGGVTCGPLPEYLASGASALQVTSITEDIPPALIEDGDLVVMFVYQEQCGAVLAVPLGWTGLGSDCGDAAIASLSVYYKHWHTGDANSVTVVGVAGVQMKIVLATFRGAGDPVAGAFGTGGTSPATAPGFDVGACEGCLLFALIGEFDYGDVWTSSPAMTLVRPATSDTPLTVWRDVSVGPGLSGDRGATMLFPPSWAAVLVYVPPTVHP